MLPAMRPPFHTVERENMPVHHVTFLVLVHDLKADLEATLACVTGQSWPHVLPMVVVPRSLASDVAVSVEREGRNQIKLVLVSDDSTVAERLDAGFDAADGAFVAWLDAGETCPVRRIELQVTALAKAGGVAIGIADMPAGDSESFGGPWTAIEQECSWRLLAGTLNPHSLLVPPSCYRHVGRADRSLHRLVDLDLALRLVRAFPLVGVREAVDGPLGPSPLLRFPVEAEEERRALWRVALDQAAPLGGALTLHSLNRLATAYATSCVCGDEIAEVAIISRAIALSILQLVTLILPDAPEQVAEARAAGLLFLAVDEAAGSLVALRRGLAGVRTRWVVTSRVPVEASALAALILAATAGKMAVCLNCVEPLLFGQAVSMPTLVEGTLFETSALQAVVAEMTGEEQFWDSLVRGGQTIGAVPAAYHAVARPVGSRRRGTVWQEDAGDGPPDSPLSGEAVRSMVLALVDADWYRLVNADVAAAGLEPAHHYCVFGWKEGRDPNPWFSTSYYLEAVGGVPDGSNPLEHFVRCGAKLGIQPHPQFALRWYARRYLNINPTAEALLHFLQVGISSGAVPHPWLDRMDVLGCLASLPVKSRSTMLLERLRDSESDWSPIYGLIDGAWYRDQYPDVARSGIAPVQHYLRYGYKEKRNPNIWFDTLWYLAAVGTIPSSISALEHFVTIGADQGIRPHPDFDIAWYSHHYLGLDRPGAEALRHFLQTGLRAGYLPYQDLDSPGMRARLLATAPAERPELTRQTSLTLKALKEPGAWVNMAGTDPVVWDILLLHGRPPGTIPVMVVFTPGSEEIAEILAFSLPPGEFPLYARLCGNRVELLSALDHAEPVLAFDLPDQIEKLRWLGLNVGLGRAVLSDRGMRDSILARWLRIADIPVYGNGHAAVGVNGSPSVY